MGGSQTCGGVIGAALSVTWIRKVSRRSRMYLVRVPDDYKSLFKAMVGRRVRVRIGGYMIRGRIVELSEYLYVSLPMRLRFYGRSVSLLRLR